MENEGIPVFSKEGMSLIGAGLMILVLFAMVNRGMRTSKDTGPSGAIGVRG